MSTAFRFLFFLSIISINHSSWAAVNCSPPAQTGNHWQMLCSDSDSYSRTTHYYCVFKIDIRTTYSTADAKIKHEASIQANEKNAILWSAEKFHGYPITSASIEEMQCYAQD